MVQGRGAARAAVRAPRWGDMVGDPVNRVVVSVDEATKTYRTVRLGSPGCPLVIEGEQGLRTVAAPIDESWAEKETESTEQETR